MLDDERISKRFTEERLKIFKRNNSELANDRGEFLLTRPGKISDLHMKYIFIS